MALQAPFHLERILLINGWHIINLAMARGTPDAFGHMNAVIEIGILGQVVHPLPFDRRIIAKACAHRFQIRAVRPDLTVAIHAGLGRRHSGRGGCFNRRMAITAVDAVVAGVMLVAELHGLLSL